METQFVNDTLHLEHSTGMAPDMATLIGALRTARETTDHDAERRLVEEMTPRLKRGYDLTLKASAAAARGDDVEAARCWKEVADTTDGILGARACGEVGARYMLGDGVLQNFDAGIRYLRAGANAGDGGAWDELGKAYASGSGIPQDPVEAVECYRLAIEAGDIDAHLSLAFAYANGVGVPKDQAEAVKHFRLAAKSETAIGATRTLLRSVPESSLGTAYQFGYGVEQSDDQARYWFKKADDDSDPSERKWLRQFELARKQRFGLSSFPLVSLSVTIIALLSAVVVVELLGASAVVGALLLVVAAGSWLANALVANGDVQSQSRVRDEFLAAREAGASPVRIAGTKWVLLEDEFWHLAYDGAGRGTLFKPDTSWRDRRTKELSIQKERRQSLILFSATTGFSGLLLLVGVPLMWAGWTGCCGALGCAFVVADEYRYRHGHQSVRGAMALDPPPIQLGRSEVEDQKAHGTARLATEAEAQAASVGSVRRSTVHDQEF